MAWLEGLSTLKGQITSFTKEVLSEGRDEIIDTNSELNASKRKVEELEALCASQDLEITELRQRNAELQRRILDVASQDKDDEVSVAENGGSSSTNPIELLELAKQEVIEKTQLLTFFKEQHENFQMEKQQMTVQCRTLEEEVQKLTEQLENTSTSELEQLRSQLRDYKEQLTQTKDENARAQKVADNRIEELEKELQKVHQQMLDHLSDSQVNTSEIRGEVEQTRWQLLQESGAQKTELLRARQDMVNRIIQMGEKSREVEMNMRKLQLEGKHLNAEITAIIHKLGDPEQQELIHGTLKALELENQVLKLRNAQLELVGSAETMKGSSCDLSLKSEIHSGDEEKRSVGTDSVDLNSKYSDSGSKKADDDSLETESTKSEKSEVSIIKKKLDSQISQLQTNMESYERDIESYEMLKSDWTAEKRMLEQDLCDLKMQLKEKEEALSIITAQKGLLDVKKSSSNIHNESYTALQKKMEELTAQLSHLQEEKDQLQQGKVCLSSEVEAMAKIVQDLESQLARAQEENAGLTTSLEELDEQHQGAIDQLLKVKQQLQKQNDALQSEVTSLKQQPQPQQQNTSVEPAATQTDPPTHELYSECRRTAEMELQEKISKLITFEIPKDYYNFSDNNQNEDVVTGTVAAMVKMCIECKWKRDTLERKVAELMKELRDTKHTCEEKNKAANELDGECRMLKTVIEELMVSKSGSGEGLAPIPEETEALEQKMTMLENEVEVLREARSNLEADAKKLREEGQSLVRRLEAANATLRNQENLETEVSKWQEAAAEAEQQSRQVLMSKEEEVARLHEELHKWQVEDHHRTSEGERIREEVTQEITKLRTEILEKEDQFSRMEQNYLSTRESLDRCEIENRNIKEDKSRLQLMIEKLSKEILAAQTLILEKNREFDYVSCTKLKSDEHNKQLEEELSSYKNRVTDLEVKLCNMEEQLNEALNSKNTMQKELVNFGENVSQHMEEILELKAEKILSEEAKLELENKYSELKTEHFHKDEELRDFKRANLELKEEVNRLSSIIAESESLFVPHSTGKEIERWKEMAEASERQLSEALHVRDELEHECKRLYMIESRLQNQEHLDRELERLRKLSEGMEQDSDKLLSDKLSLEQQLEIRLKQLRDIEETEKEATERAVLAEEKLIQMLRDKTELEEKCQLLQRSEEQLKEVEKNFSKKKELCIRLEQELNEVVSSRNDLEAECRRLLAVEGKLRNQETLEQEVKELKQKWETAQKELSDVLLAKSEVKDQNLEESDVVKYQIKNLEDEQQRIQLVLNTTIQENESLKAENFQLQKIISNHEAEKERQFQDIEASQMAKETVANLSKMIKDKDMEIEALKLKSETLVTMLHEKDKLVGDTEALSEQLNRLNSERIELIKTVQVKHQESVQYHNEIRRLTDVLTQEMENIKTLTQQYEEKQRQVLAMDNELVTAKKRIHELEIGSTENSETVQNRPEVQWEEPPRIPTYNDLEITVPQQKDEVTLPEDLRMQLETLQSECSRMADSLLQEQTRNKYLQNEVQEQYEKESVLIKELERLRLHLLAVEEGYTQEALKAEEQVKDFQNKLLQAEERIKNSSTAYTSANIRANQHVESLQGQARLIAQQRDDIQQKLSAAEDQVQHHSAALRNLQIVLEQFQKDKEREINSATGRLQQQLLETQRHNEELNGEISVLKVQLAEAKEGLSAASRLGEQLDKKTDIINSLKEEVTKVTSLLQESETQMQSANLNVEGKIDRYLVKNLVLGYFLAPQNTRGQVLRIVATVLDFNQEERDKIGLDSAGATSSGWFRSLLQPGKGPPNMQSLSEAFVRFLENESQPQPKLSLLPEVQEGSRSRSDSRSSDSPMNSQRRSPLLLSEVQLPTFTQFPVGRNSSSILKDVLKDS